MLETAIQRALVVVAHPDDPEFMAGGTIAQWTDSGVQVAYCVVSDGSKGTEDRSVSPSRLSELRRAEQLAAAKVLGVSDVTFLGCTDGEIRPELSLRVAIARQIRRFRPDAVVTHDPARLYFDDYINHPDHRATGEAALYAVFPTSRDHLSAPQLLSEGLEPHKVRRVYLTGALAPDTWIDIGATIERKIESLRCHASQIADSEAMAERLRKRAADLAEGRGMRYAEAFKCIALAR